MQIREYVKKSLLFAIAANYDAVWRDFNARLRKEHCNFLEAMILIALFFETREMRKTGTDAAPLAPVRVRPAVLASIFGTTRANLSHGITRLERTGLLKRLLVEGDARGYELVLKPDGKRAALRLIEAVDRLERHFESELGAGEVEGAITKLGKISAVYRQYEQ
jgi:DNA-binding MarR family transcriptional regulator